MRRALALLALAGLTATYARAADTWVEVRSTNFTISSNAGEGSARKIAWELEQVRLAFQKLWPWARLATGKRAMVIALKDEASLRQWTPGHWETKGAPAWVSISSQGADREYLLLRLESARSDSQDDVSPYFNLYRSYVSALLAASLERPLPTWLAIGLAEVNGNARVRDKEVQVGRPIPGHLTRFNAGPRFPLRAILGADANSPLVTQQGQREMFDAQCWALVHYLSFAEMGRHSQDLNKFIHLWLDGRTQDEALRDAFGDMAVIEKTLPTYTTSRVYGFGRLVADLTIEREQLPLRAVAPADVSALQAAVHVSMRRPNEAAIAIQESRQADPKLAASYDAEGLLADLQSSRDHAAEAYAKAVELGSTSFYSYYRNAQLLWKQDIDTATLASQRKLLDKAVELNPQHASTLSFLAETMAQQGEAEPALPIARKALELAPGESYQLSAIARVLLKLGQREQAQTAAERALSQAKNEHDRSNAQGLIDFIRRSGEHQQRVALNDAFDQQARGCQAGDAAACTQLLPQLEEQCGAGKASMCAFAAWLLENGKGVAKDVARAATFEERACTAGDKRSCVQRAWFMAHGEGVTKDEPKAIAALDALCTDGFLPACTRLALLYAAPPAPKNRARARELLKKSCDGAEADACTLLQKLPQ